MKQLIMKHLIEINDSSDTGKSLVNLLRQLAKQDSSISFPEKNIPEVEDPGLLEAMLKAKTSGEASEEEVLQTIANILKQ
jgi:hypothetical protein